MLITVAEDLRPMFDGVLVDSAPTVPQVHKILGPATRVRDGNGKTRAPVGHRNNQIHIYDQLGICFLEHHHTRRLIGYEIYFRTDSRSALDRGIQKSFTEALTIAGYPLSSATDLRTFFGACPVTFTPTVLGWLRAERDAFSLIITPGGAKLPSGRPSAQLRLVEIDLSWPHDPWGEPAD